MKKLISTLVLLLLLAVGTLFTACQSAFQKEEADSAKEIADNLAINSSPVVDNSLGSKITNTDEWETFRTEAEAKIRSNEMLLAELSVQLSKPGTALDTLYTKRIKELNKQNQAFINRLNAYEKNRSDWETFKRDYKSDMEELEKVLKDMAAVTKK